MLNLTELSGFNSMSSEVAHLHWRLVIRHTAGETYKLVIGDLGFMEAVGGADITGSGTASASRTYSTYTPDKAFNNTNSSDGWIPGAGVGDWIAYSFLTPVQIRQVAYYHTFLASTVSVTEMDLEWSDDFITWSFHKTFSGYAVPSQFTYVPTLLNV